MNNMVLPIHIAAGGLALDLGALALLVKKGGTLLLNATAEAVIGEGDGVPFAEQVRISVSPMRLELVLKLQRFESTARYRIGPERKPLLIEQTLDMSGSGMAQEGSAHTVTTYSDYRPVSRQHQTNNPA